MLAYNDWIVEEWSASSGGRLIPVCLVPLWDPELAADEVRRNAPRGVRMVSFSELPAYLGLPSIHDPDRHWDPFFAACDETNTVICMHIGSASHLSSTSKDAPLGVRAALTPLNSMMSLTDWLLSGVLARFPNVKIAYCESQIGWIPFMLERIDRLFQRSEAWSQFDESITELPSSYVPGRVFGCFFEDDFGLSVRSSIGISQITFEIDYPHQDTTWPNSRAVVERMAQQVTPEELELVVAR